MSFSAKERCYSFVVYITKKNSLFKAALFIMLNSEDNNPLCNGFPFVNLFPLCVIIQLRTHVNNMRQVWIRNLLIKNHFPKTTLKEHYSLGNYLDWREYIANIKRRKTPLINMFLKEFLLYSNTTSCMEIWRISAGNSRFL